MPTFPIKGKPDVNLLEQFFEPTDVVEVDKRAERLARSVKARKHRNEVKEISQRRTVRSDKSQE